MQAKQRERWPDRSQVHLLHSQWKRYEKVEYTQVLLVWRFIVGWSIGFGQPGWLAIAAEITPSQ